MVVAGGQFGSLPKHEGRPVDRAGLEQRIAKVVAISEMEGRCRYGAFIGVDRARPIPARGRDLAKPGLGRSAVRPLGERRSEEHTSELQSLMRMSYAVFCLKKKMIKQ